MENTYHFYAREYEQVEAPQYDADYIVFPATNGTSIIITLVLTILEGWIAKILDMKGGSLHGEFEKGEETLQI